MYAAKSMFTAIAASLLLAACVNLGFAQTDELRLQVTSVADDVYPNARIIVGVEDASGAAPNELTPENWLVSLNGTPVDVTGAELASSEDAPLDVAIVVDSSGSMDGAPLAAAKEAAKAFIAELQANDRVALMRFGNDVVLVQDFTADRALTSAAIDALVAEGNTALYSATTQAASLIGSSPASRRAVVLLSDGADFGGRSTATRDEAIYASAATGVPYFVIAQGSDLDRPYLQLLAEVTRGRYLEAPNPGDLQSLYVGLGRLLRSQYVITFDASSASAGAASDVTVTLTDGPRTASARTAYTPGESFLPQLTLLGIAAGDKLSSPREVTAELSAGAGKITWYVDDVNVLEQNAPPYVFTYDPAAFDEGAHTLRVTVGDGEGGPEQSITLSSTPPAAASDGGSPTLVYVGVGGLIGLVVAIAFFFMKAKRKPVERAIPADQRTTSWAQQVAQRAAEPRVAPPRAAERSANDTSGAQEDIGKALGLLVSRAGTDLGNEYRVGGKTVSIGAGPRCGVRIDDPALAFEEARIWVRDGHLMLHKFTKLTAMELQGASGGWEILEPGDRFEIGQHTFEFKLLPEGALSPEASESTPNVLRDRPADANEPPANPDQPRSRFSDLMPRAD